MRYNDKNFIQKSEGGFFSVKDERILVAKRKHWLFVVLPVIATIVSFVFFIGAAFFFFTFLHPNTILFITSGLLIFVFGTNLVSKIIVDWYLHVYIVTTKKILEVRYTPLFSHVINEILLEQVRCTEVDVQRDGILNELIDIGDVIITFDRPTHQEEFVLSQISNAPQTGMFLGTILEESSSAKQEIVQNSWFKQKDEKKPYRFTEEIFPAGSIAVQ